MPCLSHVAAISRKSSMVKWLAEWERMFSCPMPKYTEPAPALMAAASDYREPTGAMISNSSILPFMRAKLLQLWRTTKIYPLFPLSVGSGHWLPEACALSRVFVCHLFLVLFMIIFALARGVRKCSSFLIPKPPTAPQLPKWPVIRPERPCKRASLSF